MEKYLFLLINLFFSSNIIKYLILFIMFEIITGKLPVWLRFLFYNDAFLTVWIATLIILCVAYIWLKIFILILAYTKSSPNSYTHTFLNRFINNDKFTIKIFALVICLDILCIVIDNSYFSAFKFEPTANLFIWFFLGCGITLPYFILYLWAKKYKNKRKIDL